MFKQNAFNNLPLTHCSWLPQSAFNTTMPLEVNKKYIKYIDYSKTIDLLPQRVQKKMMCYCKTDSTYDCYQDVVTSISWSNTNTKSFHEC